MLLLSKYLTKRLEDTQPDLGDRSTYIGASEVGRCARRVVHEKINGRGELSPDAAGRILRGRALENEVVQLMRLQADELGWTVTNTGKNQVELRDGWLRGHPDGYLNGRVFDVKTASGIVFKWYAKNGLPTAYKEQVIANTGMHNRMNGTSVDMAHIVMVNIDTMEDLIFDIECPDDLYEEILDRADTMAACIASNQLPEGEPERSSATICKDCPIRKDCTAFTVAKAKKAAHACLPFAVEVDLADKISAINAIYESSEYEDAKRLIDKAEAIKEEIKTLVKPYPVKSYEEQGVKITTSTSERTTVDSKKLKAEQPAIYEKYTTTTNVTSVKVTFPTED